MTESSIHETEWAMSDAEEQAWDDLWDTDAARSCSCPACNYYAPDYEAHKDEPCVLTTIIDRIIAERGMLLPGQIAIPRPRITTGPKHQTVDEATAAYLREASERVKANRYWGSGVSRLVADLLSDAAYQVYRPAGDAS